MPHKLISRLIISIKVLFIASIATAQVDSIMTNAVPFVRGNWELQTKKNVWGNSFNEKIGDQDQGSSSRFNVMVETHYWFSNKFAGGIELNYDASTSKNGTEIKSTDFSVYGHLTYGINLKPNWGIYFRGGAGIGSEKTEFTSGSTSQEVKGDLFSYKFEVGAPVHVYKELFIVPYVNFRDMQIDFDDGEQNEKRFQVGLNLVSMINCDDDIELDSMPRLGRYAKGVSFIGVHAMTGYSFGTRETIGQVQSNKDDLNRFNLKVDYVYQVLPNLGIGADLGFRSMVTKSQDFDFKTTNTTYSFTPKIVWNLPTNNWLNDFFITGGYGFGADKEKSTISGNSTDFTDKFTSFNGALGYNWFVSRYSMFTFQFGYEQQTTKPENSDEKIKESGVAYQVGFRTALGPVIDVYGYFK